MISLTSQIPQDYFVRSHGDPSRLCAAGRGSERWIDWDEQGAPLGCIGVEYTRRLRRH